MTGRLRGDYYYLGITEAVAKGADCSRRQVGSIIVNENRILSTGKNGPIAGAPGCLTEDGCPRASSKVAPGSSYDTGPGRCVALHAEHNAIVRADFRDLQGATLYLVCLNPDWTLHENQDPCDACWTAVRGTGIKYVVNRNGRHEVVQVQHSVIV